MLAEALEVPDASLELALEPSVDETETERFLQMIERRAAREPLQHVIGHWPFLELDLLCDRRALVPRPETEDLADRARARLRTAAPPRTAIDVGTGSGCIALALAAGVRDARVVGIDLDVEALALAAENAARVGVEPRVTLVRGDLLDALAEPPTPDEGAALIVANLPYVAAEEWDGLAPEVRDHDPRQALVTGENGLALIRRLIRTAGVHLRPGGVLMLELAPPQAEQAVEWLAGASFEDVQVLDDRFGRPRFVSAIGPRGA
jgi:release factor glutamine methyltransferase